MKRAGDRGQESEGRGQESEVRSQKTEGAAAAGCSWARTAGRWFVAGSCARRGAEGCNAGNAFPGSRHRPDVCDRDESKVKRRDRNEDVTAVCCRGVGDGSVALLSGRGAVCCRLLLVN